MTRPLRPSPPGLLGEEDVAAMIRVDHAGEMGAVDIYRGQLAVLAARRSPAVPAVSHMLDEERGHLAAFEELVRARAVRKTALEPLRHLAGLALGAASAALGDEAAMACTAAVEEEIDAHYAGQIARLRNVEPALADKLAVFRAEELAHREAALAAGAERAPAYPLMRGAIRAGCRLAIALGTL